MSDLVKGVLTVTVCGLLVAGIIFATSTFVLGLHVFPSLVFAGIGIAVFVYLLFRPEDAPPLEMRQSSWQTLDNEKDD